ncbi:hypothetical protein [Thiocystis violacea]|uniref:hypothetical protein n=1 Tax=Thiocystis violacea TaxID=13725 RepID=UPI001906E0D7|nr:hypothetical protein [Thiocystis violacea]MBK1721392.1 hypothetical protein [Thiocystis violacea]
MKKSIGARGFQTAKALGVTGVVAMTAAVQQVANADAMLFPVMTRSSAVATIVSVVNKDPQGVVNLNYFTKSPDLATPCVDEGIKQVAASGRANDMVTFDASGVFLASEGSGPLFNDPQTLAPYGAVQFSTNNTGVARGFLIVDDGDTSSEGGTGADLYGEAIMLEIAGGAAFGYRALNTALDGPVLGNQGGLLAFLGEILDQGIGTGVAGVALLPPSEWTTRFFVTPVSDGAGGRTQRDCETCSVSIYISPDRAGTLAGMIDRDTVVRSEPFAPAPLPTAAKNVVCTGAVDMTDILPQAVVNQVSNQGGWGYVQIRSGTSGNVEDSAVVLKLEYNLVDGFATSTISPDGSTSFTGTVNNGLWLRNIGLAGTSLF